MRKWKEFRRVMALVLALVLTLGLLPIMNTPAAAADGQTDLVVSDKVADPQTLHNWQAYYGDSSVLPNGSTGISTWKAGGVWTDKSVFASDSDITAAGLPTSLNDKNAFLVSLSALASNKEITGRSSTPTDTMLVLDLSNSMDNSGSVDEMIEAANDTIDALLKMNVNNRAGVVLYSGNTSSRNPAYTSSATVILPLDRYTTTTTTQVQENGQQVTKYQYLTVSGTSDTTVSVAAGTHNSSNSKPTGSKNTNGGTYIQNGLFQAWEEFAAMTDKGVVQSGTQQGIQRTPILVLMSDGAPTIATTNYYEVGTSNTGDGTETTNRITFLTQLTAAWVKGKISAHYNSTSAKFYTLGLDTSSDENATAVLYPAGSNNTISGYWNNFNAGSTDGQSVNISGQGNNRWSVTYQSAAEAVGKNYVDRYWAASNSSSMIAAFKEIVEDIGLQSAYTPTLVQGNSADLDGYITVEDELGSMMEVKDIKGILLSDTLFTGAELAKSMNEGLLGQISNPTEYGNVFIQTVKERIGIADTSAAQSLISNAYQSKQLNYVSDSNYSNYIGWYGDADNAYLGFWQESYGYGMENAPAGAKYINKSYGFLGGSAGTDGAGDMMHVVVMVHTEITTGHQTVLFKVPASLIPKVTYKVDLEGDSLETATKLNLTVTETDPIRLLYEVGLPDDINAINLEQKVAEYLAKDGGNHIHKNADGSYTFYANSWGAHEGVAPDICALSDAEKMALTASVAESHFIPNTANERFYIQEDALVYDSAHNVLTSLPVAGGEYYFARTIVNVTGANGAAEAVTQYEKLSAATVANSSNFAINSDGQCIVKAGTIRQTLTSLELPKTSNDTNTIANSDDLWVYVPGTAATDYNVYSFLGNNGKLTVMPATGIKITKDLTEVAPNASANEQFKIVVTLDAEVDAPVVTDANGNTWTAYASEVSGGKTQVRIPLTDGQTVYITGLAAGTTYTVTETAQTKYTASYTYEDADQTTNAGVISGVIVTNEPIKPGNLYITKEVVHTHEGETFPTDYEFDFEVQFMDAGGDPLVNKTFAVENNYDASITELTTDMHGVMRGKLKHGETAFIKDIPAGTQVVVTEVNIPANYTSTTYSSSNASGMTPVVSNSSGAVTILSESNATVVVTNTYEPTPVSVTLNIDGTKIFDAEGNRDVLPSGAFNFKVQQWNGTAWVDLEGKTAKVEYAAKEDGTKYFQIADVLSGIQFERVGSYAFQVLEVAGSVENVTYDRTLYTFTVNVTDNNGQLIANITDLDDNAIENGSYEVTFTNTYHTVPVVIDVRKDVVNQSGNPDISKAHFHFAAKEAEVVEGQWTVKENGQTLTVTSDAAGEARFTATYNTAGSYYFIVTERNDAKPGWVYSAVEYKVEVLVTDDGTGNLSATLIINGVDQQSNETVIAFSNTYDPADAQVNLNALVKKQLTGRDLVAGEFTFAIFPNNQASHTGTEGAVAVGTNDASGNVTFNPETLTFSQVGKYEYDVVEITGNRNELTYDQTIYDLVIEVTDPGDGTLKANYYFEDSVDQQVTFRNTYTATPAEVVIGGLKTVQVNSGYYALTAGAFTFGLYDASGVKIAQTSNLANGTFVFDALVYDMDDLGNHTYVIKEIAPDGTTDGSYSANGMSHSGQSFTVTVTVTDNGLGALVAEVAGSGADTVRFVNEYTSTPAYVTLSGTKTLTGRDLVAGEFRFAIYRSDATFTNNQLVTDQITNDAEGKVTFNLGAMGVGYHYFVIEEVIPAERAPGVHYDASEYHITVQVTDNGTGKMTAVTTVYHPGNPHETNPAITFANTYRPEDGSIIIDGSKIYTGGKTLQAKDFSFALYEGDTLLDTADVNADGTFAFDAITYNADFIGTYTYTVKEVIPQGATQNQDGTWTLGNTTYDGTVYTVVVTVQDVNGALQVSKTVNGSADADIVFTNVHTPDPIQLNLEAVKSYNKPLQGGEFTFTLEGEGIQKQEKTNDANGKVAFDAVTLPTAKTYTFTVKEKEEILWGFIQWDKSEYTVEVKVENQNGQLVITSQTVKIGEEAKDGGIVFTNTYVLDGQDTLDLTVKKTMTGDRTDPSGFVFGLYNAAGELVESITSDADGVMSFKTLTFDETHVAGSPYTYTVREILPTNDSNQSVTKLNGVTYDQTVYTVLVTVADDNRGGVEVSYTVNGSAVDQNAYQFAFTNSYAVTGTGELTLDGTKLYTDNLTGALKDLPAGTFQFNLSGEGINETVSNADGGAFAFSTITYDADDIGNTYVYTVKEVKGSLDYIAYDEDVFTVTVKVTDNGGGGIAVEKTVTCGSSTTAAITFDNYYNVIKPGSVEIGGSKTYTDGNTGAQKIMEAGMFSFQLTGNGVNQTVTNAADGSFAFATLNYTAADIGNEYTYTVSEVKGDKSYIAYDADTFQVKVKIEDDGQGGLKITKTLVGGSEIAFQNTYKTVTGGQVQISGLKTYTDTTVQAAREMAAGMFRFHLTGNGVDQTVTNAADGSFSFQTLQYTAADIGNEYTYTITEIKGDKDYITYDQTQYELKVKIEDDGQGGLKITKTLDGKNADEIRVTFANTYYAKPVSVTLEGTKTYNKPLQGNDFTFTLTGEGVSQTQKNDANGKIVFDALTFTKPGVYTYTVKEVDFLLGFIQYHKEAYEVKITVTDDNAGQLVAAVEVNGKQNGSMVFENTYQLVEQGELTITGTKTLVGGKPLADGEFTFGLYDAQGNLVASAVNENGAFTITKVYSAEELGQYTYTLKEMIPEEAVQNSDGTWTDGNITYDPTVYTVRVSVADNQVGGIAVSYELVDAQAITFQNKYTPDPEEVLIMVQKVLNNKSDEEVSLENFQFVIKLDENEFTAESNAEGKTGFSVTFSEADIGMTYELLVSEINTGIKGMIYDTTVHTVTVQVLQNEDGTLQTVINGTEGDTIELVFTNTYEELVTPPLGDDFNLWLPISLMVLGLLGVVGMVVSRKKRKA